MCGGMRRIPVSALEPGLVLAKTVFGDRGEVLLAKGATLTQGSIRALRRRGFRAVYVRDGLADDIEPMDVVSEQVQATVVRRMHDLFAMVQHAARASAEKGRADLLLPAKWQKLWERLYRDVENIIDDVLEAETLDGLVSLKSHDNYTFTHSIDVAVGAIGLGKAIGLDRSDLHQLALSSLLHDIGKIYIQHEILNKPGPLTPEEWEVVRKHPEWGYETIRKMPIDEVFPKHVALQHHERQDGSGYPRGLRGSNKVARSLWERFSPDRILLVTEIMQVADVYSALSSDRPQRPAYPPEQVVAQMREMAGPHLNRELVNLFLRLVPTFPVGITVRVREGKWRGYRGVVSKVSPLAPDRPVVRILVDPRGQFISPFEIDLQKEKEVQIASVFDLTAPLPGEE